MKAVRVVAVGGGTGMPILIKGLLKVVSRVDAVVTVADDGGSSGLLRRELAVPPPGDSRNCLVAMAGGSAMGRLFQYRFAHGEGLKSHAVGNLVIAALTEMTGDFNEALAQAAELIGARGRVFPPSLQPLTLFADVEPWSDNGLRRVTGQCNIANRLRPLRTVGIEPAAAPANPAALEVIDRADLIILGPGSLFTSVLANLLVKDIAEAVRRARAEKIFFGNITVQPGETDDFTAADHLAALIRFAGAGICDRMVTSSTIFSRARLDELAAARSAPIVVDEGKIRDLGVGHTAADLTDEAHPTHHSADKLARLFEDVLLQSS